MHPHLEFSIGRRIGIDLDCNKTPWWFKDHDLRIFVPVGIVYCHEDNFSGLLFFLWPFSLFIGRE